MSEYKFLTDRKPILWINENRKSFSLEYMTIDEKKLEEAEIRLEKFAPLMEKLFPETEITNGIIESKLTKIENMEKSFKLNNGFKGSLYLKEDNNLPIAGSVKARGGIYEVLKHAEDIALENGVLKEKDSYMKLGKDDAKKLFSKYKIQVGSTGNLGLSIGIISAKLGFEVIVHMSEDAKQWKKDLLREKGVNVKEYSGDYGKAVEEGRPLSDNDSTSYFVDDENSIDLFLGYTVAASRISKQLEKQNILVNKNHPLFVYLPCGVGGAPGGIGYGLKRLYGDNVHIFFIEPIESPCMLLSICSQKHEKISVQDIGLTGKTEADGLAVGRSSGLISRLMTPLISGVFTVEDRVLEKYMRELWNKENIFLEPSGCSSLEGPLKLFKYDEGRKYLTDNGLVDYIDNSTHIAWGTGGNLVPESIREKILYE